MKTHPKIELHCHLEGILDPIIFWDIYQDDPHLPIDPGSIERVYPAETHESFLQWLDFIKSIEGKLDNFYLILDRYIERAKAQRVLYLELMIGSSEIPRDKVRAIDEIRNFRDWINQKEAGEIQIELLVAFSRRKPVLEVQKLAETILFLYEAGLIVGVALAGPEQGYPVKPFHRIFAEFHQAGLGIEIHAGEWCGPESIWDALEYGFPDRLGHGVSLFQDQKLLGTVKERGIHIEMCPTSNLKTGSISHIEQHPVRKAKEMNLSFSINTDDPGPFACSMESEYELLSNVFCFDDDDFQNIYYNSLSARFQPTLRNNISEPFRDDETEEEKFI